MLQTTRLNSTQKKYLVVTRFHNVVHFATACNGGFHGGAALVSLVVRSRLYYYMETFNFLPCLS